MIPSIASSLRIYLGISATYLDDVNTTSVSMRDDCKHLSAHITTTKGTPIADSRSPKSHLSSWTVDNIRGRRLLQRYLSLDRLDRRSLAG